MSHKTAAMKTSKTKGHSVYIVDGARTPFLKAAGKPGEFSGADLAVQAGRSLLLRQAFSPDAIDEVVIGSAVSVPDETNVARIIALRLGCGDAVPAYTVQRNCASGMQALDSAFKDITSGRCNLVLAGGTDAMSQSPLLFNKTMVTWLAGWMQAKTVGRRAQLISQLKPRYFAPVIALLKGLTDPIIGWTMGQTAEELAYDFSIDRQQMDTFAVRSHQRLVSAMAENHYPELVPLYSKTGEVFDFDNGVRPDSSVERLAKLKPFFDKKYGMVTPGNSSQVTDGAALLLLASEEAVNRHQLPVLGRIVDTQWSGLAPEVMGLGPAYASAALLKRHNLSMSDIATWEINEAFAAQVLACEAALGDPIFCQEKLHLDAAFGSIDPSKVNVDGGAIAMGHPIGATGARITLHALHTLKRLQSRYAVATLCIGGGQGGAVLLESV